MSKEKESITEEDALAYHAEGKPGKISILPTKPLMTQRDLSLGYSPGVAYPCLHIEKEPLKAYDYTARGNMVAVISNGTAVLGLGDLGALASKPVMEGKAILFKRFADVDAIDLEVDTKDVDEFINCVKYLGPSWGGINLEDIAAPDCFVIEEKLRGMMDIPVFHDDQHGTAIIVAAGLINAAHLTKRKLEDMKVVVLGAGSAGIACLELIKKMGIKHENALLVDREGVIYEGRTTGGMNQWKSKHAVKTDKRTLEDAMDGADFFMGLAAKNAVTQDMVKSMAPNPVIFAMANPDPEIRPEDVHAVRSDAIVATGRSDYPNQVNNVMGFPYIFRGALDVRASSINDEMKIAAAEALAKLAREDVPEEVSAAYRGRKMEYGPNYIIPAPFDPRLITTVAPAVAQAAMDSGVARKPIENMFAYRKELAARRDPTASSMQVIFDKVREKPQRMIFAEGEEEKIIRVAVQWRDNDYGKPILVGRTNKVEEAAARLGVDLTGIEIANAAVSEHIDDYIDYLYPRLQRKGYLYRDVGRMVKNDRNIFASCMLAAGHGDALITGVTRNYTVSIDNIRQVIDTKPGEFLFGMSIIVLKGRTYFFSDTSINELATGEELAQIAMRTAEKARRMGQKPRVALLSYSTFGNPMGSRAAHIREAVKILDASQVNFEYDGEMSASVALNKEMMSLYPFCKLSGPANILVMPGLHSAHISSHLLQELGDGVSVGPVLIGLSHPAQVVQMNASASEILNMAAIAAVQAIEDREEMSELAGMASNVKAVK